MTERLATFVSGGGTTMQEMIKECQSGKLPIDIACVLSSNPTAGAIEKARRLGIPERDIVVVDPGNFRGDNGKIDQEEFGYKIVQVLREHDATVVTQNGWLPKTPEIVINAFPWNIFNQHPGPVPEFGGKGMFGRRVHTAVLLFNRMTRREEPWTEAIAQWVYCDYDQGPVVRSERVNIFSADTVEDLQQRVLPVEHDVQIQLLHDIANRDIAERAPRPRLVTPQEVPVLAFAKKVARLLYPNG